MATPSNHRGDGSPGCGRSPFAKQGPGEKGGDQRNAGLHEQDVGHRGVGERHHEGGGGNGKTQGDAEACEPHALEKSDGAARAIAPQHETQKEKGGEKGAPENHGPTVINSEEAGNGAAKTPDEGRARDEKNAAAPAAGVVSEMNAAGCCVHGTRLICQSFSCHDLKRQGLRRLRSVFFMHSLLDFAQGRSKI